MASSAQSESSAEPRAAGPTSRKPSAKAENPELTAAWLRLSLTPGIGPMNGRQLATACGGAQNIWQHGTPDLLRIEGIGEKTVRLLADASPDTAQQLSEQCARQGIDILCIEDERYPAALRQIDDAPLILFARGRIAALQHPRLLAVVGARKADSEGRLLTRRWCALLARQGIGIVSGMAFGIDAAAHGGALEAATGDGPTIAVLGCGLSSPLSSLQQKQVEAIGGNGCVISEFLPEEEARPQHFPRRNRIIAGISAATLVVQADMRSGSLITARLAADYGREVFAVPGSVLGGRHAGCHQLLRDGATLAESPDDILTTMGWQHTAGEQRIDYTPASDAEAKIMQALDGNIMHIDTLAEYCDLTLPDLSPILLALELLGVVDALPGSRYTLGRVG